MVKSFSPDELPVGFAWLCGACYKLPSDSTNLLQSVSNNANATDDVEAEIKDEPVQKPNKIPNNDKNLHHRRLIAHIRLPTRSRCASDIAAAYVPMEVVGRSR